MQQTPLVFNSISHRRRGWTEGYCSQNHCHTFWELGWVVSGQVRWHTHSKRSSVVRTGQTIFIAPHHYHYEEVLQNAVLAWIGFRASVVQVAGIPTHQVLKTANILPELQYLFEKIDHESRSSFPYYQERIPLLLEELLLLLRRSTDLQTRSSLKLFRPMGPIEASRSYIECNIREELTMEQVARYHGFSLSHFESLFTAKYKESPKKFQQKCRLLLVEKMMSVGIRSPKAFAQELGLHDVGYFCRWFKKWTGKTPSLYIRHKSWNR